MLDQAFELLHVATQGLQHQRRFGAVASRRQRQFEDPSGQRDGVQRRSQIVRHEGEVLFPALLYLQRALGGISLQGEADRLVEDPIEDVEGPPLEAQAVLLGEVVDAAAQDVVLRDDLFDVECVLEALQSMRRRAGFAERLRDRLIRFRPQCCSQFVQQPRHVIVERRDVELPRRRQLPNLSPPAREQCLALLLDERGQLVRTSTVISPPSDATHVGGTDRAPRALIHDDSTSEHVTFRLVSPDAAWFSSQPCRAAPYTPSGGWFNW